MAADTTPVFAFYCIGNDDCKIPLDICMDALLCGLARAKEHHPRLRSSFILLHDFDEREPEHVALRKKLNDEGVSIVPFNDESVFDGSRKVQAIAVGSIRGLRSGGDLANINLHKRFSHLDDWEKRFQGRLGQVGNAYAVPIPPETGLPMQNIVLVVAPNMNPVRAGYSDNASMNRLLLEEAYLSMFEHFVQLAGQSGTQNHCPSSTATNDSATVNTDTGSSFSNAKRPRMLTAACTRSVTAELKPIGLGTLPFGVIYPDPSRRPSESQVQDMIMDAAAYQPKDRRGLMHLIDVADTYCAGKDDSHYVERLIGNLFEKQPELREKLVIATKYGMMRINNESSGWRVRFNMSREFIRESLKASLEALGTNSVFLWQLHHADQIYRKGRAILMRILNEAFDLVREGLINHVGLCNCNKELLFDIHRSIASEHKILSVQNEYSFWSRDAERKGVFEACKELDLLFIAYAPLGGLKARRGERCVEEAFPEVVEISIQKQCSPVQVYLQYLLFRGRRCGVKHMILIPSGRTPSKVAECVRACDVNLTTVDIDLLDRGWGRRK